MREAIGGTWLFGLVITFIVFFASFLAISINYSKAFNVKNNIVDIISKYEGNNSSARDEISEYLKSNGYMVLGNCGDDYIAYDLTGYKTSDGKGYYCIKSSSSVNSSSISKNYYKVKVFFSLSLPGLENFFTFPIEGETSAIYFPSDN